MKLTNYQNLPQPIVDAVRNHGYSKGSAHKSVTGLLGPPRIAVLADRHEDELEEDAADRIWALMGQVVHGILERAETEGVAERRLSIEVNGWTISGQMDRYHDETLQDYKVVTVYKFENGKVPEEYGAQLNIYAEILRQNGHPVKKLQIVGILRDWSKMMAKRERENGYPQSQVVIRDVPLWSSEKAQKFIHERVVLHQQALVNLPECNEEERWARPTKWAVMKEGGSRAVKLYDTEALAASHASTHKSLRVEVRPGQSVRCENYCSVAKFCTQYKKQEPASQVMAQTESE